MRPPERHKFLTVVCVMTQEVVKDSDMAQGFHEDGGKTAKKQKHYMRGCGEICGT